MGEKKLTYNYKSDDDDGKTNLQEPFKLYINQKRKNIYS